MSSDPHYESKNRRQLRAAAWRSAGVCPLSAVVQSIEHRGLTGLTMSAMRMSAAIECNIASG
jgi:hypothetical protein